MQIKHLLLASLLIFVMGTSHAAPFDNMYIFGDSLSDTGNTKLCTDKGSLNGRFCNGKLWNDWLSQRLKLPLPVTSKNNAEGIPNSTNFSCSTATTTPSITNNIPGVSDIQEQIIGKKNLNGDLILDNAFDREGRNFNAKDIVFVWAGANNLFYTEQTGIIAAEDGMKVVLDLLGQRDIKKLVLLNLPNIGVTPRYSDGSNPEGQKEAAQFSSTFNEELERQMDLFRAKYPQTQTATVDIYSIFNNLLKNYKNEGFTYGNDTYWTKDIAQDPDNFIFFDDIHPTEAGHQHIAEKIFEQLVISPTERLWNGQLNTLWSVAGAMREFAATIETQSNQRELNANKKSSIWATALGSYTNQKGSTQAPGYNSRSWGYALGADYLATPNWLTGISLGNSFGTHDMDELLGHIRQDATMGALYAKTSFIQDKESQLTLNILAAFGSSQQKSSTYTPNLMEESQHGKWTDTSWLLEAITTWEQKITDKTYWNIFSGLQYVDVAQENMTNIGTYENYHINNASLYALRLPFGTSITHKIPLKGISSLSLIANVAVHQDIARDNPSGTINAGKMSWTAHGSNPAHTSFNINLGALYRISAEWGFSLNYNLNTSSTTNIQTTRLNATYTF